MPKFRLQKLFSETQPKENEEEKKRVPIRAFEDFKKTVSRNQLMKDEKFLSPKSKKSSFFEMEFNENYNLNKPKQAPHIMIKDWVNPINVARMHSDEIKSSKEEYLRDQNKIIKFSNTISEEVSDEVETHLPQNKTFDKTENNLDQQDYKEWTQIRKKESTLSVKPILKTSQEFFTKRAGN